MAGICCFVVYYEITQWLLQNARTINVRNLVAASGKSQLLLNSEIELCDGKKSALLFGVMIHDLDVLCSARRTLYYLLIDSSQRAMRQCLMVILFRR